MPKNNEISFGNYFKLPNPGLRSYFDIVRKGQPEIYETPFGGEQSIGELLDEWDRTLKTISAEWPELYNFENDMGEKVGPMSVMKPLEERMADIDHYYDDVLLESIPISDKACRAVINEFDRARGLVVRSESRTVENMKKSTNSGSPYFAKRRLVTGKTIPCDVIVDGTEVVQKLVMRWVPHAGDYIADTTNHHEYYAAAVLGWRGQEGGPQIDDVKQRVVWMFPYAVNISELQVYQPLIEACQKFNLVPAWVSMDAVDERITKMFDTKAPDDLVICTDFSKFDQHFNADMQNAAEHVLRGILRPDDMTRKWFTDVFPIKYMIPLAYDYGKIRRGKHGMGSGSGGTNADETLAHRALQYEAAQAKGQRLNPNSQCLGDDGVLTYPGITVEDVMLSYTAHGQEMNQTKQYVSTHDCVYLRRWHHIKYRVDGICVGVYSTKRALGRLKEQERFLDMEKILGGAEVNEDDPTSLSYKKLIILRALSILENCKYHPLFHPFVDFCISKDKYRLGLEVPGFYEHLDELAHKATEQMPDFMGYTKSLQYEAIKHKAYHYNPYTVSHVKSKYGDRSEPIDFGINNWAVVKYIKSKR